MIDKLKENWKTALVGSIVGIVILCLCCCDGKVEEPAVIEEPVVEEVTPVEEVPAEAPVEEVIE